MTGIYGNHPEDRARERELNAYLDEADAAYQKEEAIDALVKFKLDEVLNNETLFDTLDQNYEVIDKGQVMRALRELDDAIKYFNRACLSVSGVIPLGAARIPVDAVFTALSNIQQNLLRAVRHEAEEEYKNRFEV